MLFLVLMTLPYAVRPEPAPVLSPRLARSQSIPNP